MGLPTGGLVPFAGASAPTGYLLCDGTSVSTTTYADLFAVVGYTYGGSGASFLLPDLRGRTAVGAGTGTGLTARTRGANLGAETVALAATDVPAHGHGAGTLTIPAHTHGAGTLVIPPHSHTTTAGASGSPFTIAPTLGGTTGANAVATSTAISANGVTGSTGSAISANAVAGSTANSTGATTSHANIQPSLVLNYLIKT